jgi:hypothetical protein
MRNEAADLSLETDGKLTTGHTHTIPQNWIHIIAYVLMQTKSHQIHICVQTHFSGVG